MSYQTKRRRHQRHNSLTGSTYTGSSASNQLTSGSIPRPNLQLLDTIYKELRAVGDYGSRFSQSLFFSRDTHVQRFQDESGVISPFVFPSDFLTVYSGPGTQYRITEPSTSPKFGPIPSHAQVFIGNQWLQLTNQFYKADQAAHYPLQDIIGVNLDKFGLIFGAEFNIGGTIFNLGFGEFGPGINPFAIGGGTVSSRHHGGGGGRGAHEYARRYTALWPPALEGTFLGKTGRATPVYEYRNIESSSYQRDVLRTEGPAYTPTPDYSQYGIPEGMGLLAPLVGHPAGYFPGGPNTPDWVSGATIYRSWNFLNALGGGALIPSFLAGAAEWAYRGGMMGTNPLGDRYQFGTAQSDYLSRAMAARQPFYQDLYLAQAAAYGIQQGIAPIESAWYRFQAMSYFAPGGEVGAGIRLYGWMFQGAINQAMIGQAMSPFVRNMYNINPQQTMDMINTPGSYMNFAYGTPNPVTNIAVNLGQWGAGYGIGGALLQGGGGIGEGLIEAGKGFVGVSMLLAGTSLIVNTLTSMYTRSITGIPQDQASYGNLLIGGGLTAGGLLANVMFGRNILGIPSFAGGGDPLLSEGMLSIPRFQASAINVGGGNLALMDAQEYEAAFGITPTEYNKIISSMASGGELRSFSRGAGALVGLATYIGLEYLRPQAMSFLESFTTAQGTKLFSPEVSAGIYGFTEVVAILGTSQIAARIVPQIAEKLATRLGISIPAELSGLIVPGLDVIFAIGMVNSLQQSVIANAENKYVNNIINQYIKNPTPTEASYAISQIETIRQWQQRYETQIFPGPAPGGFLKMVDKSSPDYWSAQQIEMRMLAGIPGVGGMLESGSLSVQAALSDRYSPIPNTLGPGIFKVSDTFLRLSNFIRGTLGWGVQESSSQLRQDEINIANNQAALAARGTPIPGTGGFNYNQITTTTTPGFWTGTGRGRYYTDPVSTTTTTPIYDRTFYINAPESVNYNRINNITTPIYDRTYVSITSGMHTEQNYGQKYGREQNVIAAYQAIEQKYYDIQTGLYGAYSIIHKDLIASPVGSYNRMIYSTAEATAIVQMDVNSQNATDQETAYFSHLTLTQQIALTPPNELGIYSGEVHGTGPNRIYPQSNALSASYAAADVWFSTFGYDLTGGNRFAEAVVGAFEPTIVAQNPSDWANGNAGTVAGQQISMLVNAALTSPLQGRTSYQTNLFIYWLSNKTVSGGGTSVNMGSLVRGLSGPGMIESAATGAFSIPIEGPTASYNYQLNSGVYAVFQAGLKTPEGLNYPAAHGMNRLPGTFDPLTYGGDSYIQGDPNFVTSVYKGADIVTYEGPTIAASSTSPGIVHGTIYSWANFQANYNAVAGGQVGIASSIEYLKNLLTNPSFKGRSYYEDELNAALSGLNWMKMVVAKFGYNSYIAPGSKVTYGQILADQGYTYDPKTGLWTDPSTGATTPDVTPPRLITPLPGSVSALQHPGMVYNVDTGQWEPDPKGGGGITIGGPLGPAAGTTGTGPNPCFAGNTKITTISVGEMNIKDAKLGLTLSDGSVITHVFNHKFKIRKILKIKLSNKRTLKVTKDHLIYRLTPTQELHSNKHSRVGVGEWKPARNLKVGDILYNNIKIISIKNITHIGRVYNLETTPSHVFIAEGVLVHNRKDPEGDGSGLVRTSIHHAPTLTIGGACFVPDMKVSTINGDINISNINNKPLEKDNEVVKFIEHEDKEYSILIFKIAEIEDIKVTPEHVIWDQGRKIWKNAYKFKVGDKLLDIDNKEHIIINIEKSKYKGKVYNIETKKHTYYINKILVHNLKTYVDSAPYRSMYFSRQSHANSPNIEIATHKVLVDAMNKNMILPPPQYWTYTMGNQVTNGMWNPFSLKVNDSNSR